MHGEIWAKQNMMTLDMKMEVNFDGCVRKKEHMTIHLVGFVSSKTTH